MNRVFGRTSTEPSDAPVGPPRSTTLGVLVTMWVRDGLISPAQGREILAAGDRAVDVTNRPRRGHSLVLEALGYLGGAIVVAAVGLIAARYWDGLGDGGRIGVLAVGWILLAVGATLVPAPGSEAVGRLRAVLWLASTVTLAAFCGVLGDTVLDLGEEGLALFVGLGTAAYAGLLWWRWRDPVQQAATVVATAIAATALLAQLSGSESLPGLGAWTVGIAWWLLAWSGVTRPARLGQLGGAGMAVVGAMGTSGSGAGIWLVLITLAAVVAAGLMLRDVWQLGLGALGVVMNVPQAVERWFPGSLAGPLILLLLGMAVVGLAVYAARRGSRRAASAAERSHGSPRLALLMMVGVVAFTGVVVLVAR